MRLVRFLALFGSLMLLVATTVSLLNRRAENRSDQTARVEASANVVSVAIRANVEAARNAVVIAGISAAGTDFTQRPALARQLASLYPDAEACVGFAVTDCTDADLFALAQLGDLAALATADEAISAVDTAGGTVLFVHRPTEAEGVTVVARVPIDSLLRETTLEIASSDGVTVDIAADSLTTTDTTGEAEVVDGRRIVEASVGSLFEEGSIAITTSVDGRVGLAGGNPALYGSLLALGTVLLALAGWTFLAERRTLEKRATTDELTGLVNRREFERVAAEAVEMADRFGTGLCVMVIDLNGFKQVNDTLGHQFGDLVLKACSERLITAVRDTDVVGRWGGDEFVILLPGLEDRTAVRNSAERISHTLADSPVVGDTIMTASIGAAIFPRHGNAFDALMRAADVAMYGAKTTGVGHRIADTISAQDDLLGDDISASSRDVHTDDYEGPDRRRSPAPPPPPPAPPLPLSYGADADAEADVDQSA